MYWNFGDLYNESTRNMVYNKLYIFCIIISDLKYNVEIDSLYLINKV